MSGNQWLRLWHEMPNDPKWRTIARHSGQPLALVQAAYLHLLVDASRNVTRGHATVTAEDLASALDCDMSQIEAVLSAMQGRVLNGQELTGWDKRQPKREDNGNETTGAKSATQRKREQREREKEATQEANVTQCHAMSRDSHGKRDMSRNRHDLVTTERDTKEKDQPKGCTQHVDLIGMSRMSRNVTLDTDKDTEKKEEQHLTSFGVGAAQAQPTTPPDNVTELPTKAAKPEPAAKAPSPRGTRLPPDWRLPREWGQWAVTDLGWDEATVRDQADRFRDHWIAKTGQMATKADWLATWRNWCRNAKTLPARKPSRHDISAVNYGQGGAL